MSRNYIKICRFTFLILFILVFLVASFVFCLEKRLFTPEDLLNLKGLSDPQISPTGDWVAFAVTQFEKDRKTNSEVWIVSRDGRTLKQITTNPGPDRAPRWSPDGKTLAFLSRRGKDRNSQIYFYSLKDQKVEKVTYEKSSIRDLKWSPDRRMIAFLMAKPLSKEDLDLRRMGDDAFVVDKDSRHTHLWIMDVESRKTRLLSHQAMTVWHFNWSQDCRKIVILASPIPTAEGNEYQSHLGLIDVQSGEEVILCKKTNAQAAPSISPDGKWISYMGPVGTFKERGVIRVIPTEGGKPVELLRNYVGNVWDVTWYPQKNTLLAAVARGTRCALLSLSLQDEPKMIFDMYHSIIPYWGNYLSVSSDGQYVAFLNETLDSPKEIWISNLGGTFKKKLTNFNSYLKDVKLGNIEAVKWVNPKDSADAEGVVVKPVDFEPDKKNPLIVWLHGGPAYNWGLGIQVRNWAQLFASQGYMVFLPNFRGSSGYGMEWMMANVRNWGEGPMSDVMSGVDHLIEKGWVDKERLFVGGGSYGGYLTSWIISHTDRFKAAYVSAGVSDLITEFALTDEPTFLIGYFQKSPYEDPEIYQQNSPLSYASHVKTPVLIVHGERDLRVPVSQAYQFYSALKHYGAKPAFVIYPREYHGVREYTHQADLMNRVLRWLKKWD